MFGILGWGVGLEEWPRGDASFDPTPLWWATLILVLARLAFRTRITGIGLLAAVLGGTLWVDLIHGWGLVGPTVVALLLLLLLATLPRPHRAR